MRVIVTGADGFIGSRLCAALYGNGMDVVACIIGASPVNALPQGITVYTSGPIAADTDWRAVLRKGDVVVHLAARVHIMRESAVDPLAEFRSVNTAGTANLARQAAAAGASRFVFMSTVGVNGNNSGNGAYTEADVPKPHNNYSVSKYEAEQELARISTGTGLPVVVLRAPLVYGPGNPGNFKSLLRLISTGLPLPLASICNAKNFLYVDNLVSALALCCTHPAAAGLYLVCDKETVTTPELMSKLSIAMGRHARLFPFPFVLLLAAGKLIGRGAAAGSLVYSLAVDSSKIRRELGWQQPATLDEGLKLTAEWYRQRGETV